MSCKLLIPAVFLLASGAVSSSETYVEESTSDPDFSGEVLANAEFRSGEGSMEIRRIYEDGEEAIAVIVAARIGFQPVVLPAEWRDAPESEKITFVYEELTGQRLPDEAYRALISSESPVSDHDFDFDVATSAGGVSNSSSCVDSNPDSHFFEIECYRHGAVGIIASKPDDVCLLTAAINGNHTMQVSYQKSGIFFNSAQHTVMQGHFAAVEVRTNKRRVRRGHLFNASPTDYSRYVFTGNSVLSNGKEPKGLDACTKYVHGE